MNQQRCKRRILLPHQLRLLFQHFGMSFLFCFSDTPRFYMLVRWSLTKTVMTCCLQYKGCPPTDRISRIWFFIFQTFKDTRASTQFCFKCIAAVLLGQKCDARDSRLGGRPLQRLPSLKSGKDGVDDLFDCKIN